MATQETRPGQKELGEQSMGPNRWIAQNYDRLDTMGWQFDTVGSKLVAAQDVQTKEHLAKWREEKTPVEMSIVLAMPNTAGIDTLPARAIGYAVSALEYSRDLRKREGVTVDRLRILAPVHINVLVNDGEKREQIDNAEAMRQLVSRIQKAYYPDLDTGIPQRDEEKEQGFLITTDVGRIITPDIEEALKPKAQELAKAHPDIVNALVKASAKYAVSENGIHPMTQDERIMAYVTAHAEAWGHAHDGLLFAKNGEQRINFIPASELQFLIYMKELEGTGWERDDDHEIATVVSAKNTRTPYYTTWEEEPTIGDLAKEIGGEQVLVSKHRQQAGRIEVAEAIDNINMLRTAAQAAAAERKRMRIPGKVPTIRELITT